tara:strand:- start:78 stop:221 length:144 start_codon:yes stop_codon:yes gene_type:complete
VRNKQEETQKMMEMKQDLIDRRDDIITQHVKKLEEKEEELKKEREVE